MNFKQNEVISPFAVQNHASLSKPLNYTDTDTLNEKQDTFNILNMKVPKNYAYIGITIIVLAVILIVLCIIFIPSHNGEDDDNGSYDPVVIKTQYGTVKGYTFTVETKSYIKSYATISTELYGWQGIPFAKPPVDSLRWTPPDSPESWDNTLECIDPKPPCVQPSGDGSEDCLYLNIYKTASSSKENDELYPVLVYFHGGGMMGGSTGDNDFYTFMSKFGDGSGVVVVQVSYRLNIFGFLALSALSKEQDNSSGNYGIQDQLKALNWIHDNIESFNGNPGLVTIAGQSSGGTAVFALMSSPQSSGLFQRAISMSGSQNISMSLAQAEIQNQPIVEAANCFSDDYKLSLKCMRSLNVSTLVNLIPDAWNCPGIFGLPKGTDGMQWNGLVIVDGKVIPYSYEDSFIQGTIQDVPFMFGNMGQEADQDPDKFVHNYTSIEWYDYLNKTYQPWDEKFDESFGTAGNIIYQLYLNESIENPQKAYDAIVADYGLGCASVLIMKNALAPINSNNPYQNNVYVFANNWNLSKAFLDIDDPSPSYKVHYAYHTLDLYMVTENWYSVGDGTYEPTESDLEGCRLLQEYWYQFMVYGNPTNNLNSNNNYIPWLTIDDTNNWPNDYNIFSINKYGSENIVNYRKPICDYIQKLGISSSRYWWAN